jgi:hypothetical protein
VVETNIHEPTDSSLLVDAAGRPAAAPLGGRIAHRAMHHVWPGSCSPRLRVRRAAGGAMDNVHGNDVPSLLRVRSSPTTAHPRRHADPLSLKNFIFVAAVQHQRRHIRANHDMKSAIK